MKKKYIDIQKDTLEKIIGSTGMGHQELLDDIKEKDKLEYSRTTLNNYFRDNRIDSVLLLAIEKRASLKYESLQNDSQLSLQNENQIGYSKTKSLNKIYQPEEAYYVPTPAIAGFLNNMTDPTFYTQLNRVQLPPEYQTINWVFEVDGDSMYPTFSNGDHIGCRKVFNTRIIRFGEPYIVDCGEGGLMLKRLYPVKDELGKTDKDILILRSDNNGYPDMEVYKVDIKHLFLVTTRISKNVGQKRSYEDQIIKMAKDLEIIKKGIK